MADPNLESSVIEPIAVTTAMLTTNVAETLDAYASGTAYAKGDQVRDDTTHHVFESLTGTTHTVTFNASTDVVNLAAHGMAAGTLIALRSTGLLPEGFAANTIYHLVTPADDTFQLAATAGGAAITFTGTGSGTITAIQSPNKGNALTDKAKWYDAGPTNPWAMHSLLYPDTPTVNALEIENTIQVSGRATGLGLFKLAGATALQVTVQAEGETVYDETISLLDDDVVTDFWTYLFEEFEYRTDLVVLGLPDYSDPLITLSLTGPGDVTCTNCVIGPERYVGIPAKGAKAGMNSFSRKQANELGKTELIKRRTAKLMTLDFLLERSRAARIYRLYERLDAQPIVFVGNSTDEPLIVFGFWKAFDKTYAHDNYVTYAATIEGL
jgi:hypothetical protein